MNTKTNETQATKYVTLPCNGAWQPVLPAFQYGANTGEFLATESRFAVTSPEGVEFHGTWQSREGATRFARSMGSYPKPAVVAEVEPYWYVPHFGRLD